MHLRFESLRGRGLESDTRVAPTASDAVRSCCKGMQPYEHCVRVDGRTAADAH